MPKSNHDIILDQKGQEQPETKDRALDPSSRRQSQPDDGADKGKYSPDQRKQSAPSDKR